MNITINNQLSPHEKQKLYVRNLCINLISAVFIAGMVAYELNVSFWFILALTPLASVVVYISRWMERIGSATIPTKIEICEQSITVYGELYYFIHYNHTFMQTDKLDIAERDSELIIGGTKKRFTFCPSFHFDEEYGWNEELRQQLRDTLEENGYSIRILPI